MTEQLGHAQSKLDSVGQTLSSCFIPNTVLCPGDAAIEQTKPWE